MEEQMYNNHTIGMGHKVTQMDKQASSTFYNHSSSLSLHTMTILQVVSYQVGAATNLPIYSSSLPCTVPCCRTKV